MYFMSNWGYFPSDEDVKVYLESKLKIQITNMQHIICLKNIQAYISHQTYDKDLTLEKLEEEMRHHGPYFWLERMTFFIVSILQ